MKCKTCQHAIKLHKHPSNRMFNGAISEQVDFIGCITLGKDNGLIVDRVVDECDGWIGKPTMYVEFLKQQIHQSQFSCAGMDCIDCVFDLSTTIESRGCNYYDFAAIKAHNFNKTEVTIEDLEQFKIK